VNPAGRGRGIGSIVDGEGAATGIGAAPLAVGPAKVAAGAAFGSCAVVEVALPGSMEVCGFAGAATVFA
jgi:hypothetical protein